MTYGLRQTLVLENFPSTETARALSPNGRAHWATKRTHTQTTHGVVSIKATIQNLRPMHGLVEIQPTFIYPVERKRDDDNLGTGVMKAVRDALVRRGYLQADDTDHVRQLPAKVVVQKRRRALILEFAEMAQAAGCSDAAEAVLNDDQAQASAHQSTSETSSVPTA